MNLANSSESFVEESGDDSVSVFKLGCRKLIISDSEGPWVSQSCPAFIIFTSDFGAFFLFCFPLFFPYVFPIFLKFSSYVFPMFLIYSGGFYLMFLLYFSYVFFLRNIWDVFL